MNPFFSIIIPTYNRPHFLKKAIESCVNQLFKNFEVIIVNDGSKIGIDEYRQIETFCLNKKNIKFIHKENHGLAEARNTGIDNSSGEFICFLDDDDLYKENHLQVLYNLILYNEKKIGFYRTYSYKISEKNIKKQWTGDDLMNYPNPIYKIFGSLLTANNVCLSKEIVSVHRFNKMVPIAEDYELWTKILAEYPYYEVKEFTTFYNQTGVTMSTGSISNYFKFIKAMDIIFKNEKVRKQLSKKFIKKIYSKYYSWIFSNLINSDCKSSEFYTLRKDVISRVDSIFFYKWLLLYYKNKF